jgi:hypothetical protein
VHVGRAGQLLVGDPIDVAGDGHEHPPVVDVGADEHVHVRGCTGRDPLDRYPGNDVAVEDRLPRHRVDDLAAQLLRNRPREQLGVDLGLHLQQPLHGERRNRVTFGGHAEPLRDVPAHPQGDVGA